MAVEAFLERRIAFPDIAAVIARTLERLPGSGENTLDAILAADAAARTVATRAIGAPPASGVRGIA